MSWPGSVNPQARCFRRFDPFLRSILCAVGRRGMTSAPRALTGLLAVGWLAHGGSAIAQGGDKFTARLAWVPTAGVDRVSGKGVASATLSGRALTITGSFEGLGGPAT